MALTHEFSKRHNSKTPIRRSQTWLESKQRETKGGDERVFSMQIVE
jgi:hypothetical protein